VLFGHTSWFQALDLQGVWEKWLRVEESWKVDVACNAIRTVATVQGDRVAELLSPYEDKPDPWPQRIRYVLGWLADHDTRKLFELRLRTFQRGMLGNVDVLFSEKLGKREPSWLVDLLAAALGHERERRRWGQPHPSTRNGFRPYWIPHHLTKTIQKAAEQVPEYFWNMVLPFVLEAVEGNAMQAYPGERAAFDGDKIWQADAFMHKHAGDMPLPELLAMACGQLAKSDYAFATVESKIFL
jgi:hypothetical protein